MRNITMRKIVVLPMEKNTHRLKILPCGMIISPAFNVERVSLKKETLKSI